MPILRLLRPSHWLKNGFVFAGVLFSHRTSTDIIHASIGFIAFCAAASAVYIANDLDDIASDRLHPVKAKRPLASGAVTPQQAKTVEIVALAIALTASVQVSYEALFLVGAYLSINAAYSYRLKYVAVLDVFIIALGFMLRILMGTVAIGIAPSQWLLLTGLMLTLFLGFCKRRAEMRYPYKQPMLDQLITVTAGGTIISYALYTVAPETVAYHHSHALFYTTPFVIYGILRYLVLAGDDAARHLLTDPHLMAAGVLWLATVMAVVW